MDLNFNILQMRTDRRTDEQTISLLNSYCILKFPRLVFVLYNKFYLASDNWELYPTKSNKYSEYSSSFITRAIFGKYS